MATKLPEKEYICEVLSYQDGQMFWKHRPLAHFKTKRAFSIWNARFPLGRAGRQMHGSAYRQIMIDNVRYLEHRLVAQMHGLNTDHEIDHIDGNGLNNKIENLRPATRFENTRNNGGWAKKNERSGVHKKSNGRFIANIRIGGKNVHLGTFASQDEASKARIEAEVKHYGAYSLEASRVEPVYKSARRLVA
jgi:hypothetical protein